MQHNTEFKPHVQVRVNQLLEFWLISRAWHGHSSVRTEAALSRLNAILDKLDPSSKLYEQVFELQQNIIYGGKSARTA